MSYVLKPSSGGSGVQNPMTENLDANGFSVSQVKDLEATRLVEGLIIVGSQSVAGATVNAGNELAHSDPMGTVGFFGVPPTPQQVVAFPVVGANPHTNEDTINQICFALQALGLIQ